MKIARRIAPATAALLAVAGLASACASPGPAGPMVTVFETSKQTGVTARGYVPTNTILNFGLSLVNQTKSAVRILSAQLVTPSGNDVRTVSFTAYSGRMASLPTGMQGNLPKVCPVFFSHPYPVSAIVAKPHAWSTWFLLASFSLTRPGRYNLAVVKINYETAGHRAWQFLYDSVTLIALPPAAGKKYVDKHPCGS
jgi:hypothetical protein